MTMWNGGQHQPGSQQLLYGVQQQVAPIAIGGYHQNPGPYLQGGQIYTQYQDYESIQHQQQDQSQQTLPYQQSQSAAGPVPIQAGSYQQGVQSGTTQQHVQQEGTAGGSAVYNYELNGLGRGYQQNMQYNQQQNELSWEGWHRQQALQSQQSQHPSVSGGPVHGQQGVQIYAASSQAQGALGNGATSQTPGPWGAYQHQYYYGQELPPQGGHASQYVAGAYQPEVQAAQSNPSGQQPQVSPGPTPYAPAQSAAYPGYAANSNAWWDQQAGMLQPQSNWNQGNQVGQQQATEHTQTATSSGLYIQKAQQQAEASIATRRDAYGGGLSGVSLQFSQQGSQQQHAPQPAPQQRYASQQPYMQPSLPGAQDQQPASKQQQAGPPHQAPQQPHQEWRYIPPPPPPPKPAIRQQTQYPSQLQKQAGPASYGNSGQPAASGAPGGRPPAGAPLHGGQQGAATQHLSVQGQEIQIVYPSGRGPQQPSRGQWGQCKPPGPAPTEGQQQLSGYGQYQVQQAAGASAGQMQTQVTGQQSSGATAGAHQSGPEAQAAAAAVGDGLRAQRSRFGGYQGSCQPPVPGYRGQHVASQQPGASEQTLQYQPPLGPWGDHRQGAQQQPQQAETCRSQDAGQSVALGSQGQQPQGGWNGNQAAVGGQQPPNWTPNYGPPAGASVGVQVPQLLPAYVSQQHQPAAPPQHPNVGHSGAASTHPTGPVPPAPITPAPATDAREVLLPPGRLKRSRKVVFIVRGLSGSGKTFAAQRIRQIEIEQGGEAPRIHSLDDYFMTEIEKEEEEDGVRRGRKRKVIEMVYEYEADMEVMYLQQLLAAFTKSVKEARFTTLIVEAPFVKAADFRSFWMAA